MTTPSHHSRRGASCRIDLPPADRDLRVPAKPLSAPVAGGPAWPALLRRTWWRLHRGLRARPVQPAIWC